MVHDGWSTAFIMADLHVYYEMHATHNMKELPKVRPFADYIKWYNKRPIDGSKEFWQKTMEGLEAPTQISKALAGSDK